MDTSEQLAEALDRISTSSALWEREMAQQLVLKAWPDERLRARAEELSVRLARLDEDEFHPKRLRMRAGEYTPDDFMEEIDGISPLDWDGFAHRLLNIVEVPEPGVELHQSMVAYEPSPIRVIFELVEELTPDDVIFDLGAGLGKVALLVAWLTGAEVRAVEIDPALADRLVDIAAELGIEGIEVVNEDARRVSYADATAFYAYDPFRGEIFDAVLARMHQTIEHPARIYAWGERRTTWYGVPWLSFAKRTRRNLALFIGV